VLLVLFITTIISPPQNIIAQDHPNDAGSSIIIKWQLSPDDSVIERYIIFRRITGTTEYEKIGFVKNGTSVRRQKFEAIDYIFGRKEIDLLRLQ